MTAGDVGALLDALVSRGVYSASFGEDGNLRDVTFFQGLLGLPGIATVPEIEKYAPENAVDAAAMALANRGRTEKTDE